MMLFIKNIAKYILGSLLILIVIYFLVDYIKLELIEESTKEISLIKNRKIKERKIIFLFRNSKKIVYDRNQIINKIIISSKTYIDIKKIKTEESIYISGGAILKTQKDSIDIEKDYVKLKGYMGIIDKKSKNFYIDNLGNFIPKIEVFRDDETLK